MEKNKGGKRNGQKKGGMEEESKGKREDGIEGFKNGGERERERRNERSEE